MGVLIVADQSGDLGEKTASPTCTALKISTTGKAEPGGQSNQRYIKPQRFEEANAFRITIKSAKIKGTGKNR